MARFETRAKGVGVDQDWQLLNSERSVNVVYKNTTKNPIVVSILAISQQTGATRAQIDLKVINGARAVSTTEEGLTGVSVSLVVPVNASYEVNALEGDTGTWWWEMR